MGLTVSRKTAKNLTVRRKNERILTVSRKKMLGVKKSNHKIRCQRSFVDSNVLCAYVLWKSPVVMGAANTCCNWSGELQSKPEV